MESVYDQISRYQQALDQLEHANKDDIASPALRTLIARDEIALTLRRKDSSASPTAIQLLAKNDLRLINLAVRIEAALGRERLKSWRQSIRPEENSWWWSLDDLANAKQPRLNRLWTLLAVGFLAISFGFVADTFNLLRSVGENPISTAGSLVQAALTLLAASAFTSAGRERLIDAFSKLGIKRRRFRGKYRMLLALAVLGLTILIRFYLPTLAARYFQRRGDQLLAEGLVQRAIPAYQQAAALEPYSIRTHSDLARAAEKDGDYSRAIQEYKSVIALYEREGPKALDDSYYFAQENLARLLILNDKNYSGARQILDRLESNINQVSPQNRKLLQYFLLTHRGWAHLELKRYDKAEGELSFALKLYNGVAAHYLLGLTLEAENKEKEATEQWCDFIRTLQQDPKQAEEAQPDWIDYAEEKLVKGGC